MIRSNIMRIIMILSSVMIVLGVLIMYQVSEASDDQEVITVHIQEGSIETVAFADLTLIPGASCEYAIRIKSDTAESCEVVLDFVEKQEGNLGDFAYVRVISNQDVIYDDLLAKAFDAQGIVFSAEFDKRKNTDLTVIYYLPDTVGNEARNAEAVFELQIKASNE